MSPWAQLGPQLPWSLGEKGACLHEPEVPWGGAVPGRVVLCGCNIWPSVLCGQCAWADFCLELSPLCFGRREPAALGTGVGGGEGWQLQEGRPVVISASRRPAIPSSLFLSQRLKPRWPALGSVLAGAGAAVRCVSSQARASLCLATCPPASLWSRSMGFGATGLLWPL